jgi:RNA polymerase sigma-70 factor (ECF subfamily)
MRSMMEDRFLIWRFKRGSQGALRRIYEKYRLDLLKLAVSLAGDVHAAEDVVQDVFVSFAQTGSRIQPAGDLRKYLVTCVANRMRNRRRDQGRHETPGLDEAAEQIVCAAKRPEQWAILNEELRSLSAAMAQIPYEQREVIGLYMAGDLTFRQIAEIQNASINTVQGRYRYGMNRLRTLLNGELNHEAGA